MPARHFTACDPEQLRLLLADQLPEQMQAIVTEHISSCEACRQSLESIAGDAGWWSEVECSLRSHAADTSNSGSPGSLSGNPSETDDSFESDFVVDFLEPSDRPDALGRLGEYEILEVIGRGGMGVVLKGFHQELARFVAVKVMAPHLAASGAARQRFVREARAAAAIVHPHVMPIHSVCTASRVQYLVMPFVACESLQERIDRVGPLEVTEILRIGLQAAQGLAASHAQGLVHRDVKPANILLEKGVDRVMLTDFGLARAMDDASLTRTGIVTGTPQYMSPEQSCGEAVDARSDLFSLGSVLYAMSAGRPPFRAETALAVMRRISDTQARSIREINPRIPDWLEHIVTRLHDKSPDRRFQSAAELVGLLERCLAHVQQPTVNQLPEELRRSSEPAGVLRAETLTRNARSNRKWMLAGCCVLMSVAALLLAISQRGDVNPGVTVPPAVRMKPNDGPTASDADAWRAGVSEVANAHRQSPTSPRIPVPFGPTDLPVEVGWNFQGSYPDFLSDWGTKWDGAVEQLADGLKVSRQAMADESKYAVAFEVKGELAGDFEITLDYRDFKSTAFSMDWRIPRIDISGHIYSSDNPAEPTEVLGIAHRRETNGKMSLMAMQGDKRVDGNLVWKSAALTCTRDSGRLRLVRQGALIFYQSAPLDTEDWSTITSYPIDQGSFSSVALGLRAEDLQGSGEAVLTNLTIRAARFQLR